MYVVHASSRVAISWAWRRTCVAPSDSTIFSWLSLLGLCTGRNVWPEMCENFRQQTYLNNLRTALARYVLAQPWAQLVQVSDRVGYRSLGWHSGVSSPIALALGEERHNSLRNCGRQSRLHLVLYESAEIRRARVTWAGGGGIGASRASGLASRVRTVMLLVLLARADLTTKC